MSIYTLERLEKDLVVRVNWGSSQQLVIFEFDMSGGEERKLLADSDLSLAFSKRNNEKNVFLFVDIEEKRTEVLSNSVVTDRVLSNVGLENSISAGDSNTDAFVSQVIDWDILEIIHVA